MADETKLVDSFGRLHNYLRVSVTDRCNLRCVYCMAEEGVEWLNPEQILRYEEIIEVVKTAVDLGVERVRVTGGEPLVRRDLPLLINELSRITGLKDLALTTNGLLLPRQARILREAGLTRVNISLDSLRPATYRQLTRGGDLRLALAGVKAALQAGFSPVKINVVLMKGVNDREIPDFLKLASEYPLHIRFIEYMPVGGESREHRDCFFPAASALEIAADAGLRPVRKAMGGGPAAVFTIPNGAGTIGFIAAVSRKFCRDCNRLRLTADGFLKPCLYWPDELAVRPCLGNPERLRALFQQAMKVKKKESRIEKGKSSTENRCMSRTGG